VVVTRGSMELADIIGLDQRARAGFWCMQISLMVSYLRDEDFKKRYREVPDPYYGGRKGFEVVSGLSTICRTMLCNPKGQSQLNTFFFRLCSTTLNARNVTFHLLSTARTAYSRRVLSRHSQCRCSGTNASDLTHGLTSVMV
jgi:hypothetical protein